MGQRGPGPRRAAVARGRDRPAFARSRSAVPARTGDFSEMTIPPLADLLPAIIALLVGLGVCAAAHVTAWRAHARGHKAAARRRAENAARIAPRSAGEKAG